MNTPFGFEVVKVAEADFPSEYGLFRIYGFEGRFPKPDGSESVEEAAVLVMGDPAAEVPGMPAPLVRIHSQCLTGDAFHSLRCDCRGQLEIALKRIGEEGRGVIVYELQEGRGIGLMNKLRAYELQDRGADTVEANEQLGFESDLRSYLLPGAILRYLGIGSVRLLSNNPGKVKAVEEAGVVVADRVPCVAAPAETSQAYLRTKREKMGHLLDHL
ncbi:MAG TPA: GTP cyclohydrolase II [Bryobacteraceae bacterium]|nr:GTP cyclohydrolase II [Bryobacteraceae bacterium]